MKGFSLIELVIVLAITGILITFTYPIYQEHFIRDRRNQAKATLLELANQMELYYAEHQQYQEITKPQSEYYEFTITTVPTNTFILKAIPVSTQKQIDKKCQTLTLNHLGQKRIEAGDSEVPSEAIDRCWD